MQGLQQLGTALMQIAKSTELVIEGFVMWDWTERTCDTFGFLPHRSVPFANIYIECKEDYESFAARVSKHYQDYEKDILQSIESELMGSDIDAGRKETIQEAFKALEYGLYRLPVRALLPDMERIILEDWLGTPRGAVKTLNQKQLHDALNDLTYADVVSNALYDHRLFGKFSSVLYEYVSHPSTFQGEDIPNRHAALHGWVNYGTKGFCFNTLVLYEYIVHLTPVFKNAAQVQCKT